MRVSNWLIDPDTDKTVGTTEYSNVPAIHVRVMQAPASASGGLVCGSQQNTFTSAIAGTAIDGTGNPFKYYSLLVKQTGTVTSWSVDIEISNDGVNYTSLGTPHTKASTGNGKLLCVTAPTLADFVRVNVTALTLGGGTNIITELRASQ